MHRGAVTGLGIICAIGKDLGEFWRGWLHLTVAYAGWPLFHSRLTRHDAPASVRRACTVAA